MKVLGKNSLSSKVLNGLKGVFIISICLTIYLCFIIFKDFRDVMNQTQNFGTEEFILTIGLLITAILFFIMLKNLISFFQNLSEDVCFDVTNVKLLSRVVIMIFMASIVYLVMSILEIFFSTTLAIDIFLWFLTLIIFCISVGLKIFIEIYRKAIDYKIENDFTI